MIELIPTSGTDAEGLSGSFFATAAYKWRQMFMRPVAFLCAPLLAVASPIVACVHATDASTSDTGDESATGVRSCDARAFGAKGDGVTKDTAALQAAIDACADVGGEVHLQKGTFLSGMLRLKSNMIFHVHGGATLRGSLDDADYPDTTPATNNSQLHNCKKTLLYAEGVHDLHLTGTGIIDGHGDAAKWHGSSKTLP